MVYTDLDEAGEYTAVAPAVTVAGGGTVSADIQLIHGGILAGMVRDKVTGKGIGGLRVALEGPSAAKGGEWGFES